MTMPAEHNPLPQIKAATAAADEVEEGLALLDGLRGLLAETEQEVAPDG